MTAALHVENLTTGYGAATVVRNVSFSLGQGEVACLLGRNGAGKSTIVRALMGLMPRSGRIKLGDQVISKWRGNRIQQAGMVCVPQDFDVIEGLSLLDHFRLAGRTHEPELLLDKAADMFPVLGERGEQDAATLSGGERKMLGIALALSSQPSVILMDEPTEGVAPIIVSQLVSVLKNLDTSASILLIEQNIDTALALGKHAYILETGSIVDEGPIEDLSSLGVLEERLAV